jgi:HEPN domain-containing protein/predicted nucleotidyltransferase
LREAAGTKYVERRQATNNIGAGGTESFRSLAARLRSAKLSYRILGVILFGSTARDEATSHSDVDLLVVAEPLPEKPHRRAPEIAELKRLFSGVPLDVLLLTPDEVRCNFANHNPLFLDMAEDGAVLLDDGTLNDWVRATREYIRRRGIIRTADGWRFPVERGAPTYLSKVSNRDFASGMLKDAERDWQIGRRLLADAFYDKAVYHFQQATEKAVKGALIALGVFQRSHVVGTVLRQAAAEDRIPAQWRRPLVEAASLSEELEPDVSLSRYPGIIDDALWLPSEEYTHEDAQAAEAKSAKALTIARDFVEAWFAPPPETGG